MIRDLRIVAVDDEEFMLEQFRMECEKLEGIRIEQLFDDPFDALEYLNDHSADVVFLDVEMPGMKGIELASKIRERHPKIVIIFITAYESYAVEAVKMKADYYMLKPYSSKEIKAVIEHAKLLSDRLDKRIKIQCFGDFEIMVDKRPIAFRSQKAKELLAILVDKGVPVTPEEAFSLMWEDKEYDNYTGSAYRKALAKLEHTLAEHECGEVLVRASGGCGINKSVIDCDYYDYLDGKKIPFSGEYMNHYKWAEGTLRQLRGEGESV